MQVFLYIRFSTPAQEWGDSEARQLRLGHDVLGGRGLTATRILKDAGLSGWTGAHRLKGEMGQFQKELDDGLIQAGDVLAFESFDRLSREDKFIAAQFVFAMLSAGMILIKTSTNRQYDRTMGIGETIEVLVEQDHANAFSVDLAGRMDSSWTRRRDAARTEGKCLGGRGPAWLKMEGGAWRKIDTRCDLLCQIFKDYVNGIGKWRIAARLNEAGVPTWGGGDRWYPSYIGKLIANRAVIGEWQPHRKSKKAVRRTAEGDPIADYYPRVISFELFASAQALRAGLAARSGRGGGRRGADFANVLTGLGRCKACGGPMVLRTHGSAPHAGGPILTCARARERARCTQRHRFKYRPYEAAIVGAVQDLLLDPASFPANGEAERLNERIGRLQDTGQELSQRLANVRDNMEDPELLDRDSFRPRHNELVLLIRQNSAALDDLRHQQTRLINNRPPDVAALIRDLRDKMVSDNATIRFDARAKVAKGLREAMEAIEFEFEHGIERVWGTAIGAVRSFCIQDDAILVYEPPASSATSPAALRIAERRTLDGHEGRSTDGTRTYVLFPGDDGP